MSKYIVLSKKPYDFNNDKNERVAGAKVAYLNKKPSARDGEQGHPPMIVSVSEEMATKLIEVPAIYDMDFEQVTGKNNKPELILTDLQFVSPIDFDLLF